MSARIEALFERYHGHVVPRAFNGGFITLSFAVSLIGAASTLELLNRRTSPKGKFNHLLLVSSAVTMGGIAIWCMHFIGNRAIDLADGEPELQIAYSSGFTALSFFVPIAVLLAAFVAVGINNTVSWWRVCIGGVLAGAAICGMHYLGNNSIDNYICIYNPINVVGAALIAVAASIVALALFFVFRAAWTTSWWKRAACSVVLAGAVSGMHWCAATGTEYQLVRLNTGSNELSRNTTVIVVICLSIGACFVMGGTAIYTARIMRRYASKAQQVVIAAAVFDKHNRILVNPDGLIPTEKITDTFLEKNASDTFSIAHPLFLWMFQASRNWSGISTLVGGMSNHLAHLPRRGRDRDSRAGIQLINEHGELIDNYDVIFRELFCVAAAGLAEKMKEHLTSVGLLWDEILPTGASGERPGHGTSSQQDGTAARPDGTTRKVKTSSTAADLAEKGIGRRKHHEFGRGALMFLVRRVQTDRETERLEAAGYRFAELRQVSNIIGSSMQIKSADFESKLHNMAAYANENNQLEPGVHMGFFGIRARVGSYGFDVAVRKGARHLLPSVQMPIDRIEQWHLDFLRQLDRLTALGMSRRIASLSNVGTREAHFAAQLTDSLDALRTWIDDPILNEAILTSTVVTLPANHGPGDAAPPQPTSLIAFRLVIPIHVNVTSPKCEFIPLNFFKVHQLVGRHASRNLAFTQSVHREMAPVLQSVPPLEKPAPAKHSDKQSRLSSRLRRFGKLSLSHPVDSEGNPIPTVLGRTSSATNSNESSSTLKLWSGRRDSDALSPGTSSFEAAPPAYTNHEAGNQSTPFGGIMVSEEIRVEVSNADDVAHPVAHEATISHRRTPTMMIRRASDSTGNMVVGEQAGTATEEGRSNSNAGVGVGGSGGGGGGIEMRTLQVAEVRTKVHAGGATQTSNVEAERMNEAPTFVDELFAISIENR
ncbi:Signaling protein YkoW [Colletotrichum tanaceti]|uniref:Signaling protein YkoW n=1 Tax=Colletotrichum tanaceti TaxID=1306861 RepID=A0A4U6XV74_9PEZI|nr:Signaling protein YkoW [Colletotrichum tanaceti]TKW59841.1 Signaling protein YkoW [Colletotrichum tanaceti]